jgi:hypothetical protein
LSDTETDSDDDDDDDDDDSESKERPHAPLADWQETLGGYQQRTELRHSTHSTRYTTTTHCQGSARIDSDSDDGGAGAAAGTSTAAGTSRASGGNDIDWDQI